MPKNIQFEGATHVFPDDFTDEEISKALASAHPAPVADKVQPRDPTKPGYVMGETVDAAKHLGGQFLHSIPEAVTGIPAAVSGVVGALGNPGKQMEIVKGLARPPLTMLQNMTAAGQPALMQQATPQQNDEAARFGGSTVGNMLLGEGVKAVAPLVRPGLQPAVEALGDAKTAVSDRITRSMIRPKEGSFDFGADPVKAAESIPHANTLGGYSENVKAALTEQEALLQKAIKLRHETASSLGANNTFDVAPSITDSYEAMAKDAESLNKSAMAKNLRKIGERQIAELKARNGGSTWLDPDQILNEKRLIRDKVKFKTNEVDQMTTNEALANHYRALDGALDELVPEARDINARYSGLIELKDLVEHQIHVQGNAPILAKGNFFQSFIKAMPETAAKSRIIEMMNQGKETMGTRLGGKPNVFYPKTGAPDYLANPSGVGTPGLTTNPPIPVGPVNWLMTPSGVGGHGLGEMPPAPVGAPNWMLTPSGVGTHGLGEMTAPDAGAPDYLSGKSRVPSTRLVRPIGKFTK